MKTSFFKLWDNISILKEQKDIETPAMKAIHTGINIDENFWDNFILLCNNPEGMSDLLGVSSEQITGWGNKIKHNLELVNKNINSDSQKTKVIDTGNISEEE